MSARQRITRDVLAVMRDAEAQCRDPLAAARCAFADFPPFIIVEIHNLHIAESSEAWWRKAERVVETQIRGVTPLRLRRRFFSRD
jgi:hypothetical protein